MSGGGGGATAGGTGRGGRGAIVLLHDLAAEEADRDGQRRRQYAAEQAQPLPWTRREVGVVQGLVVHGADVVDVRLLVALGAVLGRAFGGGHRVLTHSATRRWA